MLKVAILSVMGARSSGSTKILLEMLLPETPRSLTARFLLVLRFENYWSRD